MTKNISRAIAVLAAGALSLLAATATMADEWPLASGDYWEVTGIDVKDGGDFKYAQWLATEWRQNAEFAKSKGWLKDAKILYNAYPRKGEPDIYLIWIRADLPDAAEQEKRGQEFQDWKKTTFEAMVGESGNRAEYREVITNSLLQEAPFRK